jgi:hypothetical protein
MCSWSSSLLAAASAGTLKARRAACTQHSNNTRRQASTVDVPKLGAHAPVCWQAGRLTTAVCLSSRWAHKPDSTACDPTVWRAEKARVVAASGAAMTDANMQSYKSAWLTCALDVTAKQVCQA